MFALAKPLTDAEIRAALRRQRLRWAVRSRSTLVVDELGLANAKARVDVAVVNGCVHGYEIKSARDSLARLPRQLEWYLQCLGKLTIVYDPVHRAGIRRIAPKWCGLIEVTTGARGGVRLTTVRPGASNPHVQRLQVARLLWRDEAARLVMSYNRALPIARASRHELYTEISRSLTLSEINRAVLEAMRQRQEWR